MIEIPVFKNQSADFAQNIDIGGFNIEIRLTYNVRNKFWHISFSSENYSIVGIKVTINFPILLTHKAIFPVLRGDFIIQKISDVSDEDFTYDNFGEVWSLFYFTEEEMNQWKEDNGL